VEDDDTLARFYEDSYSREGADAQLYSRWRALGAVGKADHVVSLCRRTGLQPASSLEVGCGDGALLSELHRRHFGGRLHGVEISSAAVALARRREGVESVRAYDGRRIPHHDRSFDLGIVSHVLEHVPEPPQLLAETARVCAAIVVEVPLERNWSARRASRRGRSADAGHLHRLDRTAIRRIVGEAGLTTLAELFDALPLEAQTFFAGRRQLPAAFARWAIRRSLARVAPPVARRAFTLHYACLCRPPDASAAPPAARLSAPDG
jgi:SAM-dependent methyltransferase